MARSIRRTHPFLIVQKDGRYKPADRLLAFLDGL
jgi:hypothetical protein